MQAILDLLIDTILQRLSEAGFDVAQDTTKKQKEQSVLAALEDAVVLQAHEYHQLVEAARQVVSRWATGDLADAVRQLDAALEPIVNRDSQLAGDETTPSAAPS